MEIVVHCKNSLFQEKFLKKFYHFNRSSQITSVMCKMIKWDFRSRSRTFLSDSESDFFVRNPDFHMSSNDTLRRWGRRDSYFSACANPARAFLHLTPTPVHASRDKQNVLPALQEQQAPGGQTVNS